MAGEIYIADKVTLDAVKKDTTDILNKKIVVDGKNIRKITSENLSTLTTVVDVAGSGYLSDCYINIRFTRAVQLIITIDGVIVFGINPYEITDSKTIGLTRNVLEFDQETIKYKNFHGASMYSIYNSNAFPHKTLKTITNSEVFVLGELLRFEKSLKIQAIAPDDYAPLTTIYYLD